MSFIGKESKGCTYAPGWFLVNNEDCTRVTRNFKQDGDTGKVEVKEGPNGTKYVPMGSLYKDASDTAEGIVYEDVDVTKGDMPGSVVIAGTVYKDRLSENAQRGLDEVTSIKMVETSPKVTRPADFDVK